MEAGFILGGFIVGMLVRHFLSSYLNEKGKNLATKEDINEITKIVENVKADFSKDLEFLKWQFTKKANIHRIVAEREVSAIFEIGASLFDLRIATTSLRPSFDKLPDDAQRKKELFQNRFNTWAETHDSFLGVVEKHRLFLPKGVYERLMKIKALAVQEGVSFETDFRYANTDGFTFEQYQKASKNTSSLIKGIEELSQIINDRYEVEGLAQ